MVELKPCPFCGRIPTVDDCGDNRFFVRCKCGIAQDKLYGQRCDAVRRWNTRRQQPVIRGVIDESGRIKFIEQPERKKGKWLRITKDGSGGVYVCSLCNTKAHLIGYDAPSDYCHGCGAEMEVEG